MERNNVRHVKILIEIPESFRKEINRYIAEKAQGESTQGALKALIMQSTYSYMLDQGWKMNQKAINECMEILNGSKVKL